jgi:uncharacterized phage protein (TIGR02218 family)
MRGLTAPLDQTKGRYFAHACDADIGDQRCKVNLEVSQYCASGFIDKVQDNLVIELSNLTDFNSGWFSYGSIMWLDGENKNHSVEIAAHAKRGDKTVIQLWKKMPFKIQQGDHVKLYVGCDKTFSMCKVKFSNAINFQGFPHLPGNDFVMKFAKKGNVYDGSPLVK